MANHLHLGPNRISFLLFATFLHLVCCPQGICSLTVGEGEPRAECQDACTGTVRELQPGQVCHHADGTACGCLGFALHALLQLVGRIVRRRSLVQGMVNLAVLHDLGVVGPCPRLVRVFRLIRHVDFYICLHLIQVAMSILDAAAAWKVFAGPLPQLPSYAFGIHSASTGSVIAGILRAAPVVHPSHLWGLIIVHQLALPCTGVDVGIQLTHQEAHILLVHSSMPYLARKPSKYVLLDGASSHSGLCVSEISPVLRELTTATQKAMHPNLNILHNNSAG